MERIWAPWRAEYILAKKSRKCIFCQKPKSKQDEKNYILKRSRFSYSMLNVFPYNNGHIMVAPYRHIQKLKMLKEAEILDLLSLVISSCDLIDEALKPKGYNIGINVGKISGAGFSNHLHFHIVPRWMGDTNFMPVIAETKVIPQSLDSLYKRLKGCLVENGSKKRK